LVKKNLNPSPLSRQKMGVYLVRLLSSLSRVESDWSLKIDLMGSSIPQRGMQPLPVIEQKVSCESVSDFRDHRVMVKINLFILDCPPEPFHKDVVVNPAAAIHADPDPCPLKTPRELHTGELNLFIRIEDVGFGEAQGLLQGSQTEPCVQCRRDLPGQNIPAEPVHDRHQVNKSTKHPNVGDIRIPDPIGTINHQISQQIRILLMLLGGLTQPRLWTDGLQSHQPHQAPHPFRIDPIPLAIQPGRHSIYPIKRCSRKLLVKEVHQLEIIAIVSLGLIIIRRSGETE